jgi:hypothetical protein
MEEKVLKMRALRQKKELGSAMVGQFRMSVAAT